MKRKIALAIVAVVALVLLLHSCQKSAAENLSAEEVQQKAYEYLASQYSAKFTIINAQREPDVVGPIPSFRSSFHWELTAVSDRFPDDTFELRYGRYGNGKTWDWKDNYCTLLFRDESTVICTEYATEFFGIDCMAETSVHGWLDGIEENTTFQEWVQTGGKVTKVTIWFRDFLPDEDEFIKFSDVLMEKLPIISYIKCRGLAEDGYQAISEQQDVLNTIWDEHQEWIIGQIDYNPESREIVLSQRYYTD